MGKLLAFFFSVAVCVFSNSVSFACTACSASYQQTESQKETADDYGVPEEESEETVVAAPASVVGPNGGSLIIFDNGFAALEILLDPEEGVLYALPMEADGYESISLEEDELEIKIFAMTWFYQENENVELPLVLILKPLQYDWDGEVTTDHSQFELEHEHLKEVKTFEGIISRIEIAGREFKNVPVNYSPSFSE